MERRAKIGFSVVGLSCMLVMATAIVFDHTVNETGCNETKCYEPYQLALFSIVAISPILLLVVSFYTMWCMGIFKIFTDPYSLMKDSKNRN